jgi:hypothetical protein
VDPSGSVTKHGSLWSGGSVTVVGTTVEVVTGTGREVVVVGAGTVVVGSAVTGAHAARTRITSRDRRATGIQRI